MKPRLHTWFHLTQHNDPIQVSLNDQLSTDTDTNDSTGKTIKYATYGTYALASDVKSSRLSLEFLWYRICMKIIKWYVSEDQCLKFDSW